MLSLALTAYVLAEEMERYPFMEAHSDRLYGQVRPGEFVALNLSTTRVLWTLAEPAVRVFSKPAFVGDMIILVVDEDSASEVLGVKDGEVRWRTHTDAAPMVRHSSPIACGEAVLVGDWWRGEVSALVASTGRTQWHQGGDPDHRFVHPPAVRGSSAFYLSYKDRNTTEITEISCETGEVLGAARVSGAWGTILLSNDHAILLNTTDHSGSDVGSFDLRRNAMTWRFHISDLVRNRPMLVGETLILNEEALLIIGVNTGRILYRHPVEYFPGFAVAGEKLIRQSGARELSAIDLRSYETTWRTTLPGKVVSNPVTNGDSVYARIDPGRVLEISAATGKVIRSIQLE